MSGVKIFKMKDKTESFRVGKGLLFDLPFSLAIIGRSMLSGKTNLAINLLYQTDSRLYRDDFLPEDIYIWSPSAKSDFKLMTYIEQKEIPAENIFMEYNEKEIDDVYELLKEEYEEALKNNEKPRHKLIYFDDMSAGGNFKKKTNGVMAKIAMNGRHILLSSLITAQKYTDLPTSLRENLRGGIFFSGTDLQLEKIAEDHNILQDKKQFRNMYREVTKEPHTFLVVNYSNPVESRYLNCDFLPIGACGKPKGNGCKCA
jgi:hypothetical protein